MGQRVSPLQGEIWGVNFDPVEGHEQGGYRPALVISRSRFNTSGVELAIVLPLTRTIRGLPTEVVINPPDGGLSDTSAILCHQPRTVSHFRLGRRWGQVYPETISKALRLTGKLISQDPTL